MILAYLDAGEQKSDTFCTKSRLQAWSRLIFPCFFCYREVSLVLLFYRYLKSLKVESRQISIIIFYNIEKNSKKYAKSIYKDTNVCYADAVTDRPFC